MEENQHEKGKNCAILLVLKIKPFFPIALLVRSLSYHFCAHKTQGTRRANTHHIAKFLQPTKRTFYSPLAFCKYFYLLISLRFFVAFSTRFRSFILHFPFLFVSFQAKRNLNRSFFLSFDLCACVFVALSLSPKANATASSSVFPQE